MTNKRFPAHVIPFLLVGPMVAVVGLGRSRTMYNAPQTTRFRTEAETKELRRDNLENTIDGFGLTYKQFIDLSGQKKILPTEYDSWRISTEIHDWYDNDQAPIDLSEDGLGKFVRVDISERVADDLRAKYNTKNLGGKK